MTEKLYTYQFVLTNGLIISVQAPSYIEAAKQVREAYYS